jgi:hypothetical protein
MLPSTVNAIPCTDKRSGWFAIDARCGVNLGIEKRLKQPRRFDSVVQALAYGEQVQKQPWPEGLFQAAARHVLRTRYGAAAGDEATVYSYRVQTPAGDLDVSVHDVSICCRFRDVEAAKKLLGWTPGFIAQTHRLNPYSGKWNFHETQRATLLYRFMNELDKLVMPAAVDGPAQEASEARATATRGQQGPGSSAGKAEEESRHG